MWMLMDSASAQMSRRLGINLGEQELSTVFSFIMGKHRDD